MANLVSKKEGFSIEPDGHDLILFKRLLEISKEKLNARNNSIVNWQAFEKDVDNALRSAKNDLSELSNWNIEYVGGHKFPDIVAKIADRKSLGIEVKTISSKENKWKVMGGSIMESTRIPDVARIYVLCAKKNPFEIKYRPFEDCVESVAVTHSPRYMLNMEQPPNESLFQKIGISYDEIRQLPNPFKPFKKELAKEHPKADVCWWQDTLDPTIDDGIEREEERLAGVLLNTKLRFWTDLEEHEKRDKRARMMILFPEVFQERCKNQYRRASIWLYNHYIINPSMRDVFSAGGRSDVSAVLRRLEKQKDEIAELFQLESVALFGNYAPQSHYEKWKNELFDIYENHPDRERLKKIVEEIGEHLH